MNCLFCIFRNKKKSLKCQFCDRFLEKSKELRDGLEYLERGFGRIFRECDFIEEKVNVIVGIIFRRHKYSAEDLLDSNHMEKIKSFCGKIKDDIDRWEAIGQLSLRVKMLYNDKAEEVRERVNEINVIVQERKPTFWERVGSFFAQLYQAVVEQLPLFARGFLIFRKAKLVGNKVA